ncbi:hypothetical protein GH714_030656 [Hevea brasiliensis]|uniref:Uncharacterized protein n=1 Tax=Hevea brasiliensis TaxID=3981 RepID=A0A6A6LFP9_HEVBR|nr:hypothetical protein GH714_030656 [Hevea brasiliensis]
MRLRGLVESAGGGGGVCLEKKEKRKFWIALSREEIEEDIFALTGSRPARRPMKRPKNVQKVLDNFFPGSWLVGTTADSYRVADPPMKVRDHLSFSTYSCTGKTTKDHQIFEVSGTFEVLLFLNLRLPYIVGKQSSKLFVCFKT